MPFSPSTLAALLDTSAACRDRGNSEAGAAAAESALAMAAAAGHVAGQARAHSLLATHRLRQGDAERAIRHGQQALPVLERSGDALAVCSLLCTLCSAFEAAGLPQPAMEHAVRALEAAKASGDAAAECWALNRLGMACEGQGEHARAQELLRQALALAEALGAAEELCSARHHLARTGIRWARSLPADDPRRAAIVRSALEDARLAVQAARSLGQPHPLALARSSHGAAASLAGRHPLAVAELEAAGREARDAGLHALAWQAEVELATAAETAGDNAAAVQRLEKLLQRPEPPADLFRVAEVHQTLHRLHKQGQQHEAALRHHEAFHLADSQARERLAQLQSRLLVQRMELEQAHGAAERARLEAHMQRMRTEQLNRAAHEDALTGLYNNRFVDEQLPRLVARARERQLPLAAVLLDLDHFTRVNHEHGHAIGDRVLADVADLLRLTTRASDLCARVGGEEFLVLLVDTPARKAHEVCERLRQRFEAYDWRNVAPGVGITASLGMAMLAPDESPQAWLSRTDAALHAAKRGGRNRVVAA